MGQGGQGVDGELGQGQPFRPQHSGIALVFVDHGLGHHRAHGPDLALENHDPFAEHRVALVGHGRTAGAGSGLASLPQFTDLGLAELEDLVGDSGNAADGDLQNRGGLGHIVPGRVPGQGRGGKAEAGHGPARHLPALRAQGGHAAHRAAALPHQHPPGQALDPFDVPPELHGPARGLEPQGDGDRLLAMGAADHRGLGMGRDQRQEGLFDGPQIPVTQGQDLLEGQDLAGVQYVLGGGAVMHELPGLRSAGPAQSLEDGGQGVAVAGVFLAHGFKVKGLHPRLVRDLPRRRRRDDPQFRLGPG